MAILGQVNAHALEKDAVPNSPLPADIVPAVDNKPLNPTPNPPPFANKNPASRAPALKSVANGVSDNAQKNRELLIPPEFNRSLMFKQDDINKVRMVHKVYLDRLKNMQAPIKDSGAADSGIEDLLSKLNRPEKPEDLPSAPVGIYLNSILFRSIGNAAAWINGKKYEIGSTADNIKLVNLTSTAAELEWRMINYKDTGINDWQAVFPTATDKDAADKQPPSRRNIEVNGADRTIHFILRPNQYLDVQGKSIREGHPAAPIAAPAPGAKPLDLPSNAKANAKIPLTDKIDMPEKFKPELVTANDKKAVYKVGEDGHFNATAKINGQSIDFRVDTGATFPVISKDDAQRIGIDVDKLEYNYEARIANGVVIKAAQTTIEKMEFDNVKFSNINMMIANGTFPQALLGSSFINKYALIDHGIMTLTSPDENPATATTPETQKPGDITAMPPATPQTPAPTPVEAPATTAQPADPSASPLKSITDIPAK